MAFDFRFGVEEEYFLVSRRSGAACGEPPADFWRDLKIRAPQASKELLQSQVEIKTTPCRRAEDCRDELVESRGVIDEIARDHGLGLLAAGTHPDFDWRESRHSVGDRYRKLVRDMRILALRNMFCGLHVHVEIPDGCSRISLMNRCSPYIPLFLALSVSSPFWRGQWTGMRGYRLTGYDELPRTGMPPVLRDDGEYEQFSAALVRAGAIEDASFIWWALRPSMRFPTLELRICDSVTDVRAATAIASFFRCLVRRLARDNAFGASPSPMLRAIADENRWQIQCDGLDAVLIDIETMEPIAAKTAIRRLMGDLQPDADDLGVADEYVVIERILQDGASADRQINIYQSAIEAGADEPEAIARVIEWLARASMAG